MWLPVLIYIFNLDANLKSIEISRQDFPDAITKERGLGSDNPDNWLGGSPLANNQVLKTPSSRTSSLKRMCFETYYNVVFFERKPDLLTVPQAGEGA